jgi:hypothetical protein
MHHGIVSSSKFMSLENLFIIRPSGLRSKKSIGVDITLLNISLCILFDEFIHIAKNIISRNTVARMARPRIT